MLHYTEVSDDRKHIEQALDVAERILGHINETIREQEGRERLREISKDLWVGQGYVLYEVFVCRRPTNLPYRADVLTLLRRRDTWVRESF